MRAFCYWHLRFNKDGQLRCQLHEYAGEDPMCPYVTQEEAAKNCIDCRLRPRAGALYEGGINNGC